MARSDSTLHAADECEWVATVRTKSGGQTVTLFGLPGQLGAYAGVSAHGIAIMGLASSSMDQGSSKDYVSAGHVSGTLLIRTALEEAATCDQAIALIQAHSLLQDWSFLVGDTVAQQVTLLEQKQGRWTKSAVTSSLLICEDDRREALLSRWESSLPGQRAAALSPDLQADRVLILGPRRAAAQLRTASTLSANPCHQRAWNFAELSVPSSRLQPATPKRLADLPAESARIGNRYTLKISPAALESGKRHAWQGSALVLGDNLASRARRAAQARGRGVTCLES